MKRYSAVVASLTLAGGVLVALLILITSLGHLPIVLAHSPIVDGANDWITSFPTPPTNDGHVMRNSSYEGEFIWTDAGGDERTEFADPEQEDLLELRLTGDATNLYFLATMNDVTTSTGNGAPMIQIAIDLDRDGSGNLTFTGTATTTVSSQAGWEYLVTTRFGSSNNNLNVWGESGPASVVGAARISNTTEIVEGSIPWSALGLAEPPTLPIRFTIAAFRSNASDNVLWTSASPNAALDVVTSQSGNTWNEISDGAVDYYFDVYFEPDGDPTSPLQISEIFYLPAGSTPLPEYANQFIELYNPAQYSAYLDGKLLGDEPDADGLQARDANFQFPGSPLTGTAYLVSPGGYVVVAIDAREYDDDLPVVTTATYGFPDHYWVGWEFDQGLDGEFHNANVPDLTRVLGRGAGYSADDNQVSLSDPGDGVILGDGTITSSQPLSSTIVDGMNYENWGGNSDPGRDYAPADTRTLDGDTPGSGPAANESLSLQRNYANANPDTNTSTIDFSVAAPTPGFAKGLIDHAIYKKGPAEVIAGDVFNYYLYYQIAGQTAPSAVITDVLPDGVEYISFDAFWPGVSLGAWNAPTLTLSLGNVPTSTIGKITVTVQLTPTASSSVLTNTASIASQSAIAEGITDNDTFVLTSTVASFDLTLIYHDLEDVVHNGETVYVAGDFNGWVSNTLALNADATFETFSITLPSLLSSVYEYKYIVSDTIPSGPAQWNWLNTNDRSYLLNSDASVNDYRDVTVSAASLQSPPTITIDLGQNTGDITGRVRIQNVTDPTGAGRGIAAQVGYGAAADQTAWTTWTAIDYAADAGTNDEFVGVLTPTVSGIYSYAVRFDGNWGMSNPNIAWTYGDLDGTPFSLDQTGVLTVNYESPPVIINETDADTPSTDIEEFIELYDGGIGNTALDNLVVVLYNGSDDQSYTPAVDLDGYTTNGQGYFVIGSDAISNVSDIVLPNGWLQNGADAVALYLGNETDFPNDTPLVTDTTLTDAIVYDTNDSDDPGLLPLLNPGQPQVNEGGQGDKDNHSNQRCPNGAGGARNTDNYYQNTPTPGAANVCPFTYDAAISKDGPIVLVPGSNVTYTIVYSNAGMFDLTGVVITDILPTDSTYVSDDNGLSCPACTLGASGTLIWTYGTTLTQGTSSSFDLVVHITGTASGILTNTAMIGADADDNLVNNVASYAARATAYDLEVTKSVDTDEVFIEGGVSQLVTYTIQINNYSLLTDTTAITVVDVLPDGFVYVSDDSGVTPTGTGTAGLPLKWNITDTITAGTGIAFNVVVSVTDSVAASDLYQNQVGILGDPDDQEHANNVAQDDGVSVWRLISMAAARALPDDASVYVKGYVNFPPGLLHGATATYDEFMFQNAALGTSGLDVYYTGTTDKFDSFGVGEEVRVWGTMDEYNGKREIIVSDPVHAVATGEATTLIPWQRQTGQIDESTESILVQTSSTVESAGSSSLDINDSSGTTIVYRDSDTGVSLADLIVGDRVLVRSVATQYDSSPPYDSGYQVALRFQSDITEYPRALTTNPTNGATGVAVGANVQATFNLTMTNVNAATFLLEGPGGSAVAGGVTYDSDTQTATFNPNADLAMDTTYTATLSADLAASNGLTLTEDYVWSFTTMSAVADLSSSTKASSASGQLMPGDLVTYTITLINSGGLDVSATVSDVLGDYYVVSDAGDLTEATPGTLTWSGSVLAGQQVVLQFVAQVVDRADLSIGTTTLNNTAQIVYDSTTLNVSDASSPWVEHYGIYLPLVTRNN